MAQMAHAGVPSNWNGRMHDGTARTRLLGCPEDCVEAGKLNGMFESGQLGVYIWDDPSGGADTGLKRNVCMFANIATCGPAAVV
jgi:hypothetical protein